MTQEQAKIVMLHNQLESSHRVIDFLYNCLQNPETYHYKYPKHILEHLKDIENTLKITGLPINVSNDNCCHSVFQADCLSCDELQKSFSMIDSAKKVLQIA